MYFHNAQHLKQFYANNLGLMVKRTLRGWMARHMVVREGESILAVGYPLPLFRKEAELCVCMPAELGAHGWPSGEGNRVCLAAEDNLPLSDESFHHAVLMHTIEHTNHLEDCLDEIWRTLVPGGRVLLVVPNRLSLWARVSSTPFGYGRPFSAMQIKRVIEKTDFTHLRSDSALFFLPSTNRWLLKLARLIEKIGTFFLPLLGGTLLVVAEKQLYAGITEPVRVKRSNGLRVGRAQPVAGKVSTRAVIPESSFPHE